MAEDSFEITGVKEICDKLDRLTKNEGRAALRKGLRAGANCMAPTIKALTPVSKDPRDKHRGLLKRSVKVRAGKKSRDTVSIRAGFGKKWFTGPTFYAPFELWGHKWGKRKAKGVIRREGDNRPEYKGNDFIRKAFAQRGRQAADIAKQTIVAEIDKIVASRGKA